MVWDSISTSDGGDVAVDDFSTPGFSTRYTSFQDFGGFRRRVYDANNQLISTVAPPLSVSGGGASLVTQFVTPLELNAIDANRLVVGGANSVYESLDQGDTITEIGPGIGVNPDAIAYGGRRSAADNADVVYVGSGDQVFTRTAAGEAMQPTASSFPGGFVRDIVLDPDDWMTAYVIDSERVFQTTDAGDSWSEVTGNLADRGMRAVELIGGAVAKVVVGGLGGVFATSLDRPGIWGALGESLPQAPVFDLDFDPEDDVLVAATLGRSAWLLEDASSEEPLTVPAVFARTASPALDVGEDGREARIELFLTAAPIENVTVPISSSDTSEGIVNVPQVVFTPTDWDQPQTVLITGVDDLEVDGDSRLTISIGPVSSATASDAAYHGLDPEDIDLVNLDNEEADFLYWVDHGRDAIFRSLSDGSSTRQLIDLRTRFDDVDENITPRYLSVDEDARQIFWSDSSRHGIFRADFSGANIETVVTPLREVRGIAIDTTAGKVYWVDPATEKIQRSNLDGTGVEDVVSGGLAGARELELDTAAGKIYWTDNVDDAIRRANLDGSAVETIFRDPGAGPTGLELNVAQGKVYWSDVTDDRVFRANLDGSDVEVLLDLRQLHRSSSSAGVAVDVSGSHVFWSDLDSGTIFRAQLDGFDPAAIATGFGSPQGLAVSQRRAGVTPLAPAGVFTDESGTTSTIEVTLDTPPATVVTIPISSDASEGSVAPSELVFDSTNWNVPQTVLVTGVDDSVLDGDTEYTIRFGSPVTADPDYAALDAVVLDATNRDDDIHLVVSSLEPTSTGFVAQLSDQLDTSVLNLYNRPGPGLGVADAELRSLAGDHVAGSLVIDPSHRSIQFIKTEGPLDPGTYTVLLRSGAEAFKSARGVLLDGNGDGTVGDNLNTTFTIAAPAPATVTVQVPNFVRGPGQAVNLPAGSSEGIPLLLSDGANVRSVDFQIAYDPNLLDITGATAGDGLPAGTSVVLDTTTAGLATVAVSSPSAWPAGEQTIVNLQAVVPVVDANQTYRRKQILDLQAVVVRGNGGNEIPSIDDDGLHLNAYAADVSGNGQVNAVDAAHVARVSVQLDEGFAVARLVDPLLLGDISKNGRINGTDAVKAAQFAAGLPVEELPPVPPGVVTFPAIMGPDPRLSIPKNLTAAPGETISVPVMIDSIVNLQSPNRLVGADLVVLFDNSVLTATSVTAGEFINRFPNWSVVPFIDNAQGALTAVAFTASPLAGEFSDILVYLNFTVNSSATGGTTEINLVETYGNRFTDLVDENDGFLTLEGPVTNAADDPIDGLLTITAATTSWTNPADNLDVDGNGVVSPNDVLVTINELNLRRIIDGDNRLPAVRSSDQFFYDVDGNGLCTVLDVLAIVNHLNFGASGEGEATGAPFVEGSAQRTSVVPRSSQQAATPALVSSAVARVGGFPRSQDSSRIVDRRIADRLFREGLPEEWLVELGLA